MNELARSQNIKMAYVTALEQKRDKTKLIKQGMMQQLLNGDGVVKILGRSYLALAIINTGKHLGGGPMSRLTVSTSLLAALVLLLGVGGGKGC